MKNKLFIGLVGSLASGKGVVADYFIKNYGFVSFSLSFIVHDELKKRGISAFTRKTLQDIGDELRAREGDGALAKRATQLLAKEGSTRVIIEGIRNPGEIEYLRKLPNFVLIAVDATRAIRFKRLVDRAKPWDPKDWDSFLIVDSRDHEDEGNKSGQQVKKCMNMADYFLENNKDLAHLYRSIQEVVRKIGGKSLPFAKALAG
jgi:dephospho-CoA kinase